MPRAIENPTEKQLYYRASNKRVLEKYKNDPVWLENRRMRFQRNVALWKEAAFMAYGGFECVCRHKKDICGVRDIEFLAIDHIGGKKKLGHAKKMGGWRLYMWLKANNYPEGFRVLCHNCNQSLGLYGRCPQSDVEKQECKNRWVR